MTSPRHRAQFRRPVVAIACGIIGIMVASSCAGSDTPEPDPAVASEVLAANLGRPRDVSERSNDPDQPGDADSVEVTNPADSSGGTGADESGGGLSTGATAVPVIKSADAPRVPGIDPFSHPTMPQEELERFIAAVETLDRDATCPPTVVPASLDGHAEVLRIADGCMHIEYHPLNGRTIWQARHEIKHADPAVFAVGFPSDDYELLQALDSLNYDDYPDQWHLRELDVQDLQDNWPREQDDKIVIAVIDSGVDERHDLLENRLIAIDPEGCHTRNLRSSHGTHVAGIVSAERGEDGVTGIAPNTKVLPVSGLFLTGVGTCMDTPTLAISIGDVWRDSHVINMSLRASRNFSNLDDEFSDELRLSREWCSAIADGESPCSDSLVRALDVCSADPSSHDCRSRLTVINGEDPVELALLAAAMRGVVSVAAAGNHGRLDQEVGVVYPAGYESTIAVANLEQDGQRTVRRFDSVNNWGSAANSRVDIAAPGTCILSTVRPGDGDRDCSPGGSGDDYDELIGTSMAAPMIAGVVAHMKARFPAATVNQITEALYNSAAEGPTDVGSNCQPRLTHNTCYGNGIVQPLAAIDYLAALISRVVYITDETGSPQIALTDPDGKRRIVTDSGMNYGPNLSPDGSRIVFARNDGSGNDLWVVNVDGSVEDQLTFSRQSEYAPSWSPDGSQIVFFRDKSTLDAKRCGVFGCLPAESMCAGPVRSW